MAKFAVAIVEDQPRGWEILHVNSLSIVTSKEELESMNWMDIADEIFEDLTLAFQDEEEVDAEEG